MVEKKAATGKGVVKQADRVARGRGRWRREAIGAEVDTRDAKEDEEEAEAKAEAAVPEEEWATDARLDPEEETSTYRRGAIVLLLLIPKVSRQS